MNYSLHRLHAAMEMLSGHLRKRSQGHTEFK